MQFAVGIELQTNRATIALLSKKGTSLSLKNCYSISFSNVNEFKSQLKKVIVRSYRHNVAVSIPVKHTIMRKFSVGFVSKQQIDQIIHYETEGHIHNQEIEDLIVDYIVLQQEQEKTKLSVAAVPINIIQKQLQIADECGIHPFIVDIDLFGLYYFFQATQKQPQNSILVHVSKSNCNFIVLKNGKVQDIRKLAMTNNLFTTDENSMGVTSEITLENLQSKNTLNTPNYCQRLLRELKTTFLTMQSVDGVYLCGNKNICTELQQQLSSKLKINIYLCKINDYINVKTNKDTCDAVIATGLALRAMQIVDGFNFRKAQFSYKNSLNILRIPLAVFLTLIAFLMIAINIYYFQQIRAQRTSYENLQTNARQIYKRNFSSPLKATYWKEISIIKRKMQNQITGPECPLPYDMVAIWSEISEVLNDIRKRYYTVVDRVIMNQNEIVFYGRTNDDVCLDILKLKLRNKSWVDQRDDSLQVQESEKLREPKDPKLTQGYEYFIRLKRTSKLQK